MADHWYKKALVFFFPDGVAYVLFWAIRDKASVTIEFDDMATQTLQTLRVSKRVSCLVITVLGLCVDGKTGRQMSHCLNTHKKLGLCVFFRFLPPIDLIVHGMEK